MTGAKVEVKVDWKSIERVLKSKKLDAQTVLDLQIISDTDPFVPMRQGTLAGSAMLSSEIGKGLIVYDMPYARHLYYGINVHSGKPFEYSKSKHPKACERWVEASKALYLDKWVRKVREVYER